MRLMLIFLLLIPLVSAQIPQEEIFRKINHSKSQWEIGEVRIKEDKMEITLLINGSEFAKLKFPLQFAGEPAHRLLEGVTFGTPVLKYKKKEVVYEVPVIFEGFEVGKVKLTPEGDIILKNKKKEGRKIKGGSPIGHLLGIVGLGLVALSQLYSVRKLRILSGRLSLWRRFHYYLGIVGGLMIMIHTGFPYDFKFFDLKKGSLGVITTYIMLIVMLSGIAGRFLPGRHFGLWRKIHIQLIGTLFIMSFIHILLSLAED